MQTRQLSRELMDDPGIDAESHHAALHGLARINRFSRSAAILWRPIRRLFDRSGVRSLRLLDVATGAGDVPRQLASLAQRRGLSLCIDACDISAQALALARSEARSSAPQIRFFQHDALSADFADSYDVVTCSLFMHHLTDADARTLLNRMRKVSRRLLLVNDLRRCRRGLWLAQIATRVLSRSHVVHVDGPLSARAAFNLHEMRALASEAGLHNARVEPRWPARLLLAWENA